MRPASIRMGLHQAEPGSGLSAAARAAYRAAGIRALVFPEYFWSRAEDAEPARAAAHYTEDLAALATLSAEESWIVVGGSLVELEDGRLYNTCPVFAEGRLVGRHRKIHLMPGEARRGLSPGSGFTVLEVGGLRLAPVICADVLHPGTFLEVARLTPDLVVSPVTSPFRPGDTRDEKDARDVGIFLRGAKEANAAVVKVGATGALFGRPLQGRCLVARPEAILFRTPLEEEQTPHAWVVEVPLGDARPGV